MYLKPALHARHKKVYQDLLITPSRICLLTSTEFHVYLNNLLGCRIPFQILNKKEYPDILVLFFQFFLTDINRVL